MATSQSNPIPTLEDSDIQRFFDKVAFNPDGCWLWTAAVNNKGYGFFGLNGDVWLAHRISYFIHTGVDPLSRKCLHSCDTPPCIRPDHLFLGSQKSNMDDMIAKGRKVQVRRSNHPRTRMTKEQLQEIKSLYRPGPRGERNSARELYNLQLAQRFGITVAYAWQIHRGLSWLDKP